MTTPSYSNCRICGSDQLDSILDLGKLPISGYFPLPTEQVPEYPLDFAKCKVCGLHQLRHVMPITELYSENYGYESHLNNFMVSHLRETATQIHDRALKSRSRVTVLDIASNDGTLLNAFSSLDETYELIGCDPLISNFVDFYPRNSIKIQRFFSKEVIPQIFHGRISLVTSLSVFYDVEEPRKFARDVWELLEDGGYWFLEQSYCQLMLSSNSFDTICHEHLLYLNFKDLLNLFSEVGFSIQEVTLNATNGGSIAILAKKESGVGFAHSETALDFLGRETALYEREYTQSRAFHENVQHVITVLKRILNNEVREGRKIYGLGASTKGNIILSYAGLNSSIIKAIGDINPKKFGRVTPGTSIPIIPEETVLQLQPDKTAILILPWHFEQTFSEKTAQFRRNGGHVIMPLPIPRFL